MAGEIERRQSGSALSGLSRRDEIRTRRSLSALEGRTLVRLAGVQAEGMVQAQKVDEIDHLGRIAVTGHSMLLHWADACAGGDPFVREELKLLTDVCRLGAGEIIADTVDSFCKESRR